MNIRIKKYLLVVFLVPFFCAANPVVAVTETQIAVTTEAANDAIVHLEAALKAVTENKLDEAKIILMPLGAQPATSWEGVRLQQKRNAVPTHLKMRVVKLRTVIQ